MERADWSLTGDIDAAAMRGRRRSLRPGACWPVNTPWQCAGEDLTNLDPQVRHSRAAQQGVDRSAQDAIQTVQTLTHWPAPPAASLRGVGARGRGLKHPSSTTRQSATLPERWRKLPAAPSASVQHEILSAQSWREKLLLIKSINREYGSTKQTFVNTGKKAHAARLAV